MTTLTIAPRGTARVHTIDVSSEHAVAIAPEDCGTVDVSAFGANVMLRFGNPESGAPDFVVVHDGDHLTVQMEMPAYARSFIDRPLDDY